MKRARLAEAIEPEAKRSKPLEDIMPAGHEGLPEHRSTGPTEDRPTKPTKDRPTDETEETASFLGSLFKEEDSASARVTSKKTKKSKKSKKTKKSKTSKKTKKPRKVSKTKKVKKTRKN